MTVKERSTWHSAHLHSAMTLTRWGHFGRPVLMFPTAGGDAEEIERFHLIGALAPLLEAGRIKVYSLDSVAGRAWFDRSLAPEQACRVQRRFQASVVDEVVPAIRHDCNTPGIEIVVAGASLGAFYAISLLCARPDLFSLAVAMSGTYDMERFTAGYRGEELYFASPLHYLPNLGDGPQLHRLRQRFALLAFAGGRWEDPEETWRMAHVLGACDVPNRVDPWGPEYDHDWPAWREMLPRYLEEFVR